MHPTVYRKQAAAIDTHSGTTCQSLSGVGRPVDLTYYKHCLGHYGSSEQLLDGHPDQRTTMSHSTNDVPTDDASPELSLSDAYRLLSAQRRRLAIATLESRDVPVPLEDLATEITRREAADGLSPETTERVAVDLHHCHLPMLADAGVVDYDSAAGRVVAFRSELAPDPAIAGL